MPAYAVKQPLVKEGDLRRSGKARLVETRGYIYKSGEEKKVRATDQAGRFLAEHDPPPPPTKHAATEIASGVPGSLSEAQIITIAKVLLHAHGPMNARQLGVRLRRADRNRPNMTKLEKEKLGAAVLARL